MALVPHGGQRRWLLFAIVSSILIICLLQYSSVVHQTAKRVRITIADSVPPLSTVKGALSAAYPSSSYYGAYGETAFDPTHPDAMSSRQRFGDAKWSNYPADQRDFKEWEFSRALVFAGTGARIQRFLDKAESGRGVVVSVVGGSVSKGRGLRKQTYHLRGGGGVRSAMTQQGRTSGLTFPVSDDPTIIGNLYNPLNLHARVFEFVNTTFPALPVARHDHPSPSSASEHDKVDVPRTLAYSDPVEFGYASSATTDEEHQPNPLIRRQRLAGSKRAWHPGYWFGSHREHDPAYSSSAGAYIGQNVFVNGAQGGVGSDYFSGCWKEHVPEDSDLVLVELGINDMRDISVMETYELLLRSLLEMPSRPAVINVQTFTLLFPQLSQASSLHVDVAAFYDTPVLSLRDVVLPRILNDLPANYENEHVDAESADDDLSPPWAEKRVVAEKEAIQRRTPADEDEELEEQEEQEEDFIEGGSEVRKWFRNVKNAGPADKKVVGGVDLMHISGNGHALLAEMVIHYLETQRIKAREARQQGTLMDYDEEGTDVPGMLLAGAYMPGKDIRRSNPFCRSTNTAVDERRLVLPQGAKGWREWAWGEKRYLISDAPGSTISFTFNIAATNPDDPEGFVKIGYQRSAVYGLGSVDCWVDDEIERKVRVDGYWNAEARNMGVITTIRDDLNEGDHFLHCTLLDETADPGGGLEFRLFAVMHD